MRSYVFILFNLVLATGFFQAYKSFETHFSGIHELKREKKILQTYVEQSHLKLQIAKYQLMELKNEVALSMKSLAPQQFKGEKGYPLRRLASITQKKENPKLLTLLAQRHFKNGKDFFKKRQYDKANSEFLKVITDYSYSVHVIESYFLLIEGLYQLHQFEQAVRYIDQMVSLYPENELTGFALLRLGKIFEFQDRHEEASGIYKTIIQTFKDYNLVQQARISFRSIKI